METQPATPNGLDHPEVAPPPQPATPPPATAAAPPEPTVPEAPPPAVRGPERSETIAALATALAKAQGQIESAAKDKSNPMFNSRYADLASVWDACRKPLSENGLAVIQTIETMPRWLVVHTTLAHESGEWMSSRLAVPVMPQVVDKFTKEKRITAQSFGSAITYARRYALAAMVGVAAADEDDDGNEASHGHRPQRDERPPQGQRAPPQSQSNRTARQEPPPEDTDVEATALATWAGKIERTTSARDLLDVVKGFRAAVRPGALLDELERVANAQKAKLGGAR